MARISPYAFFQEFDNNGDPLAGGKLYTYAAGTSTPKVTYEDAGENTTNTNPVILDSAGRGRVWLDSGAYKFVLRDSADNLIWEEDNIVADEAGGIVSYEISATTAITTNYKNARVYCTSSPTLSLLPAATAEDGFELYVKNIGSGNVTIDADGSETIDGVASIVLYPSQWALISCDGTEWRTFNSGLVKDNLTATTNPTVSDDNTQGYSNKSLWYNQSTDEVYRCIDATTGAAVWVLTTLTVDDLGAAALKGVDTNFASPTDDNLPTTLAVNTAIAAKQSVTEGTEQTTTSGTAFDFTSIPSGTKRITISFYNVGLSGTDELLIQIGDSGGIETSGYNSQSGVVRQGTTPSVITSTAGFILSSDNVMNNCSGHMILTRLDSAGTKWAASHSAYCDDGSARVTTGGGRKTLSAELDRIRITRDGTNTFDNGSVNIQYEA